MTNKSLFYANAQYANELICIFIQFFKKRMSSLSTWSLNSIHQQRMDVVIPHFVFSTQIRFWPRCHSYQGISQKLLVIVTPNFHKYLWRYSTSLQYTCYLQKLCIGNMPEKILEQYANFYEKLHNLCKWEICKLANQHFFVIFSERACQYLSPDTLLMKIDWVVTIGVSKTWFFKYIKNMG